jgi:hypothetical protein
MKSYRSAHLSILIIGLAMLSPNLMAQAESVAEVPMADPAPVPSSSRPSFPSPILEYTRPTEMEKLHLFAFDAFGPYAFAYSAVAGGLQQKSNSPPEWGGGWSGFGTRAASNFGVELVTTTTRYGMAEILREDAAYYPCQCRGFFPRFGHALISTFTGRHGKDGHTAFSFSGLVSPYAGGMAALAWYPKGYGVKDGLQMGSYNLVGQAVGNLGLEFIYGGPHAVFKHVRTSIPTGGTARGQNQ